jgi:hypothetical protein
MKMKKILPCALLAVMALSSCLKDKDFDAHKFGIKDPEGSPVGVGFPQSANRINTTSVENSDAAQTFQVALVNLLSDIPADRDIHVVLELNTQLITQYNAANDPDVLELPNGSYSIPSTTVVIPRGERTGTLTLQIPNAKNQLDITRGYALGFRIKEVEEPGVVVADNQRNILVGIAIKNQYDGIYSLRGYTLRAGDPAKTGNFTGAQMSLITTGAAGVSFADQTLWADGVEISIGEPQLAIDVVTNKVNITSSGGAMNLPGYDSRYDPATRTFYLGFTWGAGPTSRVSIDTMVFLRPRP